MSDHPALKESLARYQSQRQIILQYIEVLTSLWDDIRIEISDIGAKDAIAVHGEAIASRMIEIAQSLRSELEERDKAISEYTSTNQSEREKIENDIKSEIINNVPITDLIYKYKPHLDHIVADETVTYNAYAEILRALHDEARVVLQGACENILSDVNSYIDTYSTFCTIIMSTSDKLDLNLAIKEKDSLKSELIRLENRHGRELLRSVMEEIFVSVDTINVDAKFRLPNEVEINDIIAHGNNTPWRHRAKRRGMQPGALDFFRETYAQWLDQGIQIPSHIIRKADRDLYHRLYQQVGNSAFAPK